MTWSLDQSAVVDGRAELETASKRVLLAKNLSDPYAVLLMHSTTPVADPEPPS